MKNTTCAWVFGFCLLIILSTLIGLIALGKVEEKTSYGLPQLITLLSTLSGGFATWAFGQSGKDKE